MELRRNARTRGKILYCLCVMSIALAAFSVFPGKTVARSLSSLITTNAGGNSQDGNMFNMTAQKNVIIRRFARFQLGAADEKAQ